MTPRGKPPRVAVALSLTARREGADPGLVRWLAGVGAAPRGHRHRSPFLRAPGPRPGCGVPGSPECPNAPWQMAAAVGGLCGTAECPCFHVTLRAPHTEPGLTWGQQKGGGGDCLGCPGSHPLA